MKSKIKHIIVDLCLIFGFSLQVSAQQETVFSQFYASGIYLNPALSGLEHRISVSNLNRLQYLGINPYQSNMVSLVFPYHDKGENAYHKGGMGLNVLSSRAANGFNSTYASLNGAYNLHIASTVMQNITFGLQIGVIQRLLSYSDYRWGSQYTPGIGYDGSQIGEPDLGGKSKVLPDIGAGVLYYYNAGRNIYAPGISAYLGVAVSHINQPKENFYDLGPVSTLPMMLKVHGGFEIHMAKMLNFSPNFILLQQGQINMLMAGGTFTYLFPDHDQYFQLTRLTFGGAYRLGNAVIFLLGFGSKYYNIGFSYDLGTSLINRVAGNFSSAFEISLKLSFQLGKKAKKSSRFHTPMM